MLASAFTDPFIGRDLTGVGPSFYGSAGATPISDDAQKHLYERWFVTSLIELNAARSNCQANGKFALSLLRLRLWQDSQ